MLPLLTLLACSGERWSCWRGQRAIAGGSGRGGAAVRAALRARVLAASPADQHAAAHNLDHAAPGKLTPSHRVNLILLAATPTDFLCYSRVEARPARVTRIAARRARRARRRRTAAPRGRRPRPPTCRPLRTTTTTTTRTPRTVPIHYLDQQQQQLLCTNILQE